MPWEQQNSHLQTVVSFQRLHEIKLFFFSLNRSTLLQHVLVPISDYSSFNAISRYQQSLNSDS